MNIQELTVLTAGRSKTTSMRYPDISQIELSEIKTRLQAILFSIEEGIVMMDFAGGISIINDSAKKMLGIQKHFPYEKKFLDYVTEPSVREKLIQILESPVENILEELYINHDSNEKCLRVSKNVVTTAKGEVLGRVLVFRDITHEKNLENLKEDFVHSITHDLKSPLGSIQGYLDLFLNDDIDPLTPQQKKHMEVMRLSSKKLLKLVNNILDMAKIEAGKLTLNKSSWDIVGSVHELLTSLQALSQLMKINMKQTVVLTQDGKRKVMSLFPRTDSTPLPIIKIHADGNLIERAIGNLIDNAIKHTPQGGVIEVCVEDMTDRVQISVRDTGDGIPQNALEQIFHKFQQLSGTKGGTGLGLTFAKETVERHGGKITAASEPRKGSTFTFWIPKES